ncbi:MAG: uroporphyrinogen decarboxylase family protein [Promethearchaeota archaeon]
MSEKTPRELYKERWERVMITISIKEPDRVPVCPSAMFYATEQAGMTKKEAMYDMKRTSQAFLDLFPPMNVDLVPALGGIFPGNILDSLGCTFFKWPGAADEKQRLPDHLPFQYVEGEYMKGEEYEELFADPTGFVIRKLIPRLFTNLKGFAEFPDAYTLMGGFGLLFSLPVYYANPIVRKSNEVMFKAAQEFFQYINAQLQYETAARKLGFPMGVLFAAIAPYDMISDMLRGMRGSMLDMYRHPEELKKLMELLVETQIDLIVQQSKMNPRNKIVFIPLHRGADGFMSSEQFAEFYWPTLVKVMEGLIQNDLIPGPFFEGGYNERLEFLTEFAKQHKGKLQFWFDRTDLKKTKEMLGDYACIKGNVPGSLLVMGTPSQVEEYVKQSIEDCAEGGGFIVDGGVSGMPDNARADNVKAMVNAVFKYGLYRK